MSQRGGGLVGEPGRLGKSSQRDDPSVTLEADNPAHPWGELMHLGFFEWQMVVRRVELHPSTKLVAFIVGLYADAKTGRRARPGQERIGREAGMSPRNARRHLDVLERYGLLECVSRGSSHGRAGLASSYSLTVPSALWEQVESVPDDETVSLSPPGCEHRTPVSGVPPRTEDTGVLWTTRNTGQMEQEHRTDGTRTEDTGVHPSSPDLLQTSSSSSPSVTRTRESNDDVGWRDRVGWQKT